MQRDEPVFVGVLAAETMIPTKAGVMKRPQRLSEDWLATLLGLILVLIIALGVQVPYPLFNLFAR